MADRKRKCLIASVVKVSLPIFEQATKEAGNLTEKRILVRVLSATSAPIKYGASFSVTPGKFAL